MTITTTTAVTIVGVSASSVANNIKLAASGSQCACGSTTFTVTAPVSGAIPVNFRQTSSSLQPSAVLEFHYTWDSSTGNKADLSGCQVEEYVTYVGQSPTYYWPTPPYVVYTSNNPETGGTPVSATVPGLVDDHGHPGFVTPYKYVGVSSDQRYQFQCSYYQNNQWVQLLPLTGTIPITRIVSYKNGTTTWYYEITKSGLTASMNLP